MSLCSSANSKTGARQSTRCFTHPLIIAKDSSLEKQDPPGRRVTVSFPAVQLRLSICRASCTFTLPSSQERRLTSIDQVRVFLTFIRERSLISRRGAGKINMTSLYPQQLHIADVFENMLVQRQSLYCLQCAQGMGGIYRSGRTLQITARDTIINFVR